MESSSIVSFNNDSTFQSTLKGDSSNVSVHELALHAMRDRCLLLQRRVNALETDNMRLKLDMSKVSECSPYIPLQEDEKYNLHQKILELNRQKSQLMHHVFMVSCENKNLWSKLASIKGSNKLLKKDGNKPPLLRANTYIHSTPKTSENYQEKYPESSLEEISLKLINSYIQEKSQLVEQYEQMTQLQDFDDDLLNVDSIGFTYIEDPPTDSLKEICTQTEKLHHLKKELAKQENDLKMIISRIEIALQEGYKCSTCIAKSEKNIALEHKEIETSNSLMDFATPVDSSAYSNNVNETKPPVNQNSSDDQGTQEIREEFNNKTCPMCGQIFDKHIAFSDFQTHVEDHFIGETGPDSIFDNFENIPSSYSHEDNGT